MKKIILALMIFSTSLMAGSVVSIDMNKVFKRYHKTIKAEKKIRGQLALIESEAADLKGKYEKEIEKFRNLVQEIKSGATYDKDAREAKKEEVESLKSDIRGMESLMESFNKDSKKRLKDMRDSSRKKVLEEIIEVVKILAEKKDYDVVLDKSGKTTLTTPVIMVASSRIDITGDVLKVLNKGHEQFIADWERANGKSEDSDN